MVGFQLDTRKWAEEQFGACSFGDKRLTDRLVQYATSAAKRPDASTPQQTQSWKSCKAAYRFMDNEKVSFQSITAPHYRNTLAQATSGVWLSICDTTENSFSIKREIEGLGPAGDNTGQGFFLHSSLLINDATEEIVGLAGQELYHRVPAPVKETISGRKKRKRESQVWGRLVDQIGAPQEDARIIHVCDRGADDFEMYCHCLLNKTGWIVRAQHLTRKIRAIDPSSPENPTKCEIEPLKDYLEKCEWMGTYELSLRTSKKRIARIAHVEVRCGSIWMPATYPASPWAKKNGPAFIRMGVIEVREKTRSKKIDPLYWVLLSDDIPTNFDMAWTIIGRYEKRPLIEEFHKAEKTGVQAEERLYETSARLERIVGILCVLAVRLLMMKTIAKQEPDRPALEVAPKEWVDMVCRTMQTTFPNRKENWQPHQISIRDFLRGLAMMGGFLARKHDGEPGWLTIWKGVKELVIKLEVRRNT